MKVKELYTEEEAKNRGFDHVPIVAGKGHGYRGLGKTKLCMERCFKCGEENYAMNVSTGYCSSCGFTPNEAA